MTTTAAPRSKTRPQWATVLAVGFFATGFGVVMYALGVGLALEGMPDVGFIVIGLGAAASLFGGSAYFLDRQV